MVYTDRTPALATPEQVLAGLAGARDQLRELERGNVILAVEWAKLHRADGDSSAGPGSERAALKVPDNPRPALFEDAPWVWSELAEMGCLNVDPLELPEFALAAGLTEHSARKLLRESLMLVHLLPRVWARVCEGGLDVWRARALAADCWGLPFDAIEYIDEAMSRQALRITQTVRERIVEEALGAVEPRAELSRTELAKAAREVEVLMAAGKYGVVPVLAHLDLPDALALEAAIKAGAQALKDLGSDAPLNVRRSWALGDLARAATGHGALFPIGAAEPGRGEWVASGKRGEDPVNVGERPHWNGKGATPPQVKIFVHLPPESACPTCAQNEINLAHTPAHVEATGTSGARVLSPTAVKEWFTRPSAAGDFMPAVSLRATLNLEEFHPTAAYAPSEIMRERVHLSHGSCVFPFCSAPAWKCDIDHTKPWKPDGGGGATCSCNLAPLCRRHHRLKTHSDNEPSPGEHAKWEYTHLGGSKYYWRGPRGVAFVRSNRGTFEAAGDGASGAPVHQQAPVTAAERYRFLTEAVPGALISATNPIGAHEIPREKRARFEFRVINYAIQTERKTG